MKTFDIGLSALRAHQQTLSTLGNNIANAATPGYHRQRVELVNRPPLTSDSNHIGTGVDVNRISRMRDSAIETALLRNNSLSSYSSQHLHITKQIESLMTPGESSIHANLSEFFNRLEKISNAPQDLTVRREFLTSAAELAQSFNNMEQSLQTLNQDFRGDLDAGVDEVNRILTDIADLNRGIFEARALGKEPNDILDRRDRLMTELAEWVDVEQDTSETGREFIVVGGGASAIGQRPVEFQLTELSNGRLVLSQGSLRNEIPLSGGRLKALLDARNELVPAAVDRVNELAMQVIRATDQQHAMGMTDRGPFNVLLGQRQVSDTSVALAQTGTVFPIETGDVYVTITDAQTGGRRTERVHIDVTTDSLEDIAARFDALDGLTASVDMSRRTLNFAAEAFHAFDFAGRPDNTPDVSLMSGTSQPLFSGTYAGGVNDEWTISFSGAGTIGLTGGLTATIRNAAGQVIATKNVGAGYEAGTSFLVKDGVSLEFGAGTVQATDQVSLFVTSNSDETGMLSALGLNSLFEGRDVASLQVRADIFQQPQNLATTLTGVPGDSGNVAKMASLRDLRLDIIGGRTFVEEMADVTADFGLEVQTAESTSVQLESYRQRLEADRAAISGVDINEEMLKMMEVERAYQAAARYITTVDATLEELFRII
ncbi:MAG: flagellar hook-associated protein FlgK [Planctomyces sp.]|nr:flagellar hook-associated protein FlgK [Planctomyces sp.]